MYTKYTKEEKNLLKAAGFHAIDSHLPNYVWKMVIGDHHEVVILKDTSSEDKVEVVLFNTRYEETIYRYFVPTIRCAIFTTSEIAFLYVTKLKEEI